MGNSLSSWFKSLFGGVKMRVLLLGLDAAGKTSCVILAAITLFNCIQSVRLFVCSSMDSIAIGGTIIYFSDANLTSSPRASAILQALKLGHATPTTPTIGFNVETVRFQSLELNIWVRARASPRSLSCFLHRNIKVLSRKCAL